MARKWLRWLLPLYLTGQTLLDRAIQLIQIDLKVTVCDVDSECGVEERNKSI